MFSCFCGVGRFACTLRVCSLCNSGLGGMLCCGNFGVFLGFDLF